MFDTSTGPTPRNTRGYALLEAQRDREHIIGRMKTNIKKILNMQLENATLDEYVLNVFDVENINPTYVFLLPSGDKSHIKKLIYQKSDFVEAEFPNVTTINKFKRSLNQSSVDDEFSDEEDYSDEDMAPFLNVGEDEDDRMQEIVKDNIRTERNFIKFMDDLNDDLEAALEKKVKKVPHPVQSSSFKKTSLFTPYTYMSTKTIGWDDFGLEGWSGGLSTGLLYQHPVLERPKTKQTEEDALINIQASFDPLKFIKTPALNKIPASTTSTSTSSSSSGFISAMKNNVTAIAASSVPQRSKNPSLLLSYRVEEKLEEVLNRTKTFKGKPPRWPITNPRDAHRDEDVFIARANNPFGHSTKWRWSNETDITEAGLIDGSPQSREGRSKRGVYNLYSMIKCSTGCDPIIYKGYGCYCGFLGSGQALDGIDRCCKMHDYCYTTARCPMFLEYFVPYLWKCYRGRPLCAVDHGEWGGPDSCAARLCHCDLSLSKCLRRYHCPRKRNVCTTSPLRLLQNLVMVF
ncbi:hypothetical protein pipiens_011370 [Culex pipiens pipiens]|uniref:Phospholipase A2-like central domain-containing protein n=1 Tax=Culex pipiens pipiens TaxID=38569 RepID=A0ABD1D6N5_CULPP